MRYRHLVALTLVLTYVLILIGGATRIFEAGVSCPDWPQCYGTWWPWPEARLLAHGQPGYVVGLMHYHWWQVALEWSHRLLAGLVSFLVALLFLGAFATGLLADNKATRAPLTALAIFFTIQVSLGGVTVLLKNIHWSVALHLGAAMAVFASLAWLRRAAATPAHLQAPLLSPGQPGHRRLPWLACLFAALVFCTMLMGAMVSSSHSGPLCGLIGCYDTLLPTTPQESWHFTHRLLAVVILATSIALLASARRAARHAPAPADARYHTARSLAVKLHLMLWVQIALGLSTLFSFANYPEYYPLLSLAHLAWGTLLWLAAVGALLTLRYGTAGQFHQQRKRQPA